MMGFGILLCRVGLHDWSKYSIKGVHHPYLVRQYRECRRCGIRQQLLGGSSISEIECWLTEKSPTPR